MGGARNYWGFIGVGQIFSTAVELEDTAGQLTDDVDYSDYPPELTFLELEVNWQLAIAGT